MKPEYSEKNKKIAKTFAETNARRKLQRCFVRKVKIQYNKLNKYQRNHIDMMFVEAKRIYNHILQRGLDSGIPSKNVLYKDKDGIFHQHNLTYLSAQMKQALHKVMG